MAHSSTKHTVTKTAMLLHDNDGDWTRGSIVENLDEDHKDARYEKNG